LTGDDTTDDLVLEDKARTRLARLDVDDHVSVLTTATTLPHELALDALRRLANRLAIGDLRPADVRVDLELTQKPVDEHLQVELTHPADDRLTRLGVGAHAEGGVLVGEAAQRLTHLVLVGL